MLNIQSYVLHKFYIHYQDLCNMMKYNHHMLYQLLYNYYKALNIFNINLFHLSNMYYHKLNKFNNHYKLNILPSNHHKLYIHYHLYNNQQHKLNSYQKYQYIHHKVIYIKNINMYYLHNILDYIINIYYISYNLHIHSSILHKFYIDQNLDNSL